MNKTDYMDKSAKISILYDKNCKNILKTNFSPLFYIYHLFDSMSITGGYFVCFNKTQQISCGM